MSLDLRKPKRVPLVQFVQLFPEIKVFNLAPARFLFSSPTVPFPIGHPLGKPIQNVGTVTNDFNLAFPTKCLKSPNNRGKFHSVVGGVYLATASLEPLAACRMIHNESPSTRTWVSTARAVGIQNDLVHGSSFFGGVHPPLFCVKMIPFRPRSENAPPVGASMTSPPQSKPFTSPPEGKPAPPTLVPTEADVLFMREAIAEARLASEEGEVPIGAIVVHNGQVIARGHNRKETDQDPTAHAEILAIRRAALNFKSWRVEDSTLYVTMEPCPMCAGAILAARIGRVVYGTPDYKAGAVRTLFTLLEDGRLNHRSEVVPGVLENECREMLREFFRRQRVLGKK